MFLEYSFALFDLDGIGSVASNVTGKYVTVTRMASFIGSFGK
jgi:hypothetical protein